MFGKKTREKEIIALVKDSINKCIDEKLIEISKEDIPSIKVEVPREEKFGDFSVNTAQKKKKKARCNPRLIAENIVKNIKEREISIDRMEYLENFYSKLEKPIYYLRVANENESYLAYGNIGRCIFLSDNGCKLDYEARPSGGKFIVPFWSGCYPLYTKQEFIEKWIPYQNLLKNLIEFFS